MWSARLTRRTVKLLKWDGDLCELRLDSSAVSYLSRTVSGTSRINLLRGFNRTLVCHVQGFTLLTLVHRDLTPWWQPDDSREVFTPILCSSVSFDGDTMHRLKHDFLRKTDVELRQTLLLIHFSVLSGIIGALSCELMRAIRFSGRAASGIRLGLWMLSAMQFVVIGGLSRVLLWPFLLFLLGCAFPFLVRWILACCIKWQLKKIWNKWQLQAAL